jgi:3-oxoadipate enol-lactonase
MVHELTIETPAGAIRCLASGSGWPVILIHAFPLTADMWRPQLERAPQGWRFLAPDLRGFGGSPLPSASGTRTIADYAADVEALLDSLEIDRGVIGGLSMGGYVTFALLRRAPERFTAVVLADTKAAADTPDGRTARREMSVLVRSHGPSAVADQMIPKLLGAAARQDAGLVGRVRDMIERNTVEGIDGAIQAMLARPDSTPDLPRISVPALVILGEEDEPTPLIESETMHRAIPRSQLVVLPGCGHLSNLEAPDDFALALTNFLTSFI